jgi:hypothetical protein
MSSRAGGWRALAGPCWLGLTLSLVGLRPEAAGSAAKDKPKAAPVARDWKAHPAVVEVDTTADVYALGDVHGDYDRLVTLLVAGKIIANDPSTPKKVRWAAGRSVLVCTGDLIDKWHQSVPVLELFQALAAGAARAGGRVVVLAGNHEAEFLAHAGAGKKFADFVKELRARGTTPEDVAAGRDPLGLGAYLRGLPFAARVNDWFFAHAGNTQGRTRARLGADLRQGVDRKGFAAPVLLAADSLLEARLHPAPWWERAGDRPGQGRERLAGYVKALGVQHLVIGHQPGKVRFADGGSRRAGEMAQHFDGLLFLIDVGMSRGVGNSTGALLHVQAGKSPRARALFPDGTSRPLWAAK